MYLYIVFAAFFKCTALLLEAFIHTCLLECVSAPRVDVFIYSSCDSKKRQLERQKLFRVEINSLDSVYLINGAAHWRSRDCG